MPGSRDVARFEDFELDLRSGELRRQGRESIRLADQPFRILTTLLEHPREVVLREEIRKRLWPNDTIVEFEHSISSAMNRLRQALGDSADNPHYVETLARRGYRWMVPVQWVAPCPGEKSLVTAATENAAQSSSSASMIGKKVSHYRVLEVLGGGGMGVVYKAEDLRLGRSVAIKFLGEEFTGDHRALERFEREARTVSALDHPNVCTIYEVEEHEGQPFIVMQLLEGQTLRHQIESADKSRPIFSVRQLLDIAIAIARGLDAAHQRGIIHRDIKPANIFLTHRGEIKLLDFGLATLVSTEANHSGSPNQQEKETSRPKSEIVGQAKANLTITGATMGTTSYMSPEQVRREPLDLRTDLFSFGTVLYEMATGSQPFRGETSDVIHDAILNSIPSSHLERNPDLPTQLQSIIYRALTGMRFGKLPAFMLYTIRVTDGKVSEFFASSTFIGRALWQPDGNSLLLVSGDSENRGQVWVLSYPGKQLLRVTNDLSEYGMRADLTRDGDTLAAIEGRVRSNLWVTSSADPSEAQQITSLNAPLYGVIEAPGRRLLAIANGKLWSFTEDGKQRQQFTDLDSADTARACGRFVVVDSNQVGRAELLRFDADGSNPMKLESGNLMVPVCSPDGRYVFYVGVGPPHKIWRISVEGGTPVEIARVLGENVIGPMSISSDGEELAYPFEEFTPTPKTKLAVIPIAGGPPIKVLDAPGGVYTQDLLWSPNGKSLEYILTQNGSSNIWEQPLRGGPRRQLTHFSSGQIFDFTWSLDGRRLVLVRGEVNRDVVLLSHLH